MTRISDPTVAAAVATVMRERHSARAFLPREVPRALLEELLALAARAPSGTNLQPWRVHVVTGATRQMLVERACAAYDADDDRYQAEYSYYPAEFFEPYLGRRRKVGWDLYHLLGIRKGDAVRMKAQHRRNFELFDAPVGLFFTIDRRLSQGSWIDYGMFLQNLMLAARSHGLDTCPQAAWIHYHQIIGELLGFDANEQFLCGMALGYADRSAVENTLVTERAPVSEFAVFRD